MVGFAVAFLVVVCAPTMLASYFFYHNIYSAPEVYKSFGARIDMLSIFMYSD